MNSKKEGFDPFQIFEISQKPCYILNVKVIKGRHISKGWLKDLLDTPDPYVKVCLSTSPSLDQKLHPKDGNEDDIPTDPDLEDQKTNVVDNNKDPLWNYNLYFLVDLKRTNILTIELLDYNITEDEKLGTDTYDVNSLPIGESTPHTFSFNVKGSQINAEVDVEFLLIEDQNPALRYSLCLPKEEKEFLEERKRHVMEGMKEHLGDRAPKLGHNAPVVAVLGSGGGFRAMVGYCGAMKALYESGLIDCVTYVSGLSGSAWYLSHLYSNPDWPECSPGDLFDDLRDNITKSWTRLLRPITVLKFITEIKKKKKAGQPVSFTDFFGHLIGELILANRINSRLSDQQEVLKGGEVPMPIYTCVSVKSDVSAQEFHEWVEFTPYEVGMAKYGIFMKTPVFGSRFFLGRLLKRYPEPPLHYLQGMWGSAFTILLRRLVQDDSVSKKNRPKGCTTERQLLLEDLKRDIEEAVEEGDEEEEEEGAEDEEDGSSPNGEVEQNGEQNGEHNLLTVEDAENNEFWNRLFRRRSSKRRSGSKSPSGSRRNSTSKPRSRERSRERSKERNGERGRSQERRHSTSSARSESPEEQVQPETEADTEPDANSTTHNEEDQQQDALSFAQKVMNMMSAKYAFIRSRKGRAAFIHNYLYGLELNQVYPMSPFDHLSDEKGSEDARSNPFQHIFDPYDTEQKTLCMVDAGLSFNSPFPPLLRPQRGVDIFISLDFSARTKDNANPLEELKLAEMWARVNNIPFPRIDETIFDREGLKECYVFQNPEDPTCPVVLHFPLANVSYRDFKEPGVPRESKEEKAHGNFKVFEDSRDPYSTFNFKYTKQSFNQLVNLMEYNILNNADVIKDAMAECVERKRAQRRTRNFVFKKALKSLATQSPLFGNLMKTIGMEDHLDGEQQNGEAEPMSPIKKKTVQHKAMIKNVLSRFKKESESSSSESEDEDSK